jgi:glyoxylase-like metal-dependent hydrolase (beta-lactamase superfamily II)
MNHLAGTLINRGSNASLTIRHLATCLLCLVLTAEGQQRVDPLLSSHHKALLILEQSIAANGGLSAIRAAQTFDVTVHSRTHAIHQSYKPEPPMRPYTVIARYVSDPEHEKFFLDTDLTFPSFRLHTRSVSTKGKGYWIDHLAKAVAAEENQIAGQPLFARILPQLLLIEAQNRSSTLRWVGSSTKNARTLDAISYARADGDLYTLYVDVQSRLLERVEFLQQHVIDGDVKFTHQYIGYRTVGSLKLPSAYTTRRGRWTVTEAQIDSIAIGKTPAAQEFMVPSGYRNIATHEDAMQFETVAPGVHLVRYVPGGYNVLVVEFSDHLVVVETPEANTPNNTSAKVVALIKKNLPRKPIRFAVPTHHHSDHVGGVREYVAERATIVSTKANGDFLQELASKRFTILPDKLTNSMVPLKAELFEGNARIFKDKDQELHLYKMTPSPSHVREMLIAYLPKQRLLFQTDMFNPWTCFKRKVHHEDLGHTSALGDSEALIKTVENLGLTVDKVYGGHGLEVSFEWLKRHTQSRAADKLPMWACRAEEML